MVTDKQARKLWRLLTVGKVLTVAAARTDMDEKTARKYRRLQKLPSELARPHDWQTRVDPFAEVWPEVRVLLQGEPGLQAKTIYGELQRRYPGRFGDGQLRTFQRKVRRWRAQEGPAKEVFFAQVHEPGRLAASDFTRMNDLGVTLAGQSFDHMVYHFVLTYSNWETATICFSESFESLSEGLQNALSELGGVPARHRTDRLSTAVNNLTERKEFTQRYQALMDHYGMSAEKIQADHAHENGDIEQRHRRFKEGVEQALLLRRNRDFASREEYNRFLHGVKEQLNSGRRQRLTAELEVLRSLPSRRLEACQRRWCRVDPGALLHVERNSYSVPSRLRGEKVEVRLYAEHVEVWYAQQLVERQPRLRGRDKHRVNYRHVIDWLVRKPGAFALYRYRQEMFPSSVFRIAYDMLVSQDAATADKEYLRLLHLAAQESETAVEATLRHLQTEGQPIQVATVETLLQQQPAPTVLDVAIDAVDLSLFDDLLTEQEEEHVCRGEGEIGATVTRAASAHDADQLRGISPPGGAGDAQLRALSAGAVRTGTPGAADETDRPVAWAIPLALGEEPGNIRSQAFAGESGPASAEPARRELHRPQGEPARVWQSGFGENAFVVWVGPGTSAGGTAGVVHDVELAGAAAPGCQARPEAQASAQTPGELRGALDRRPGLRATEPRGDGSAVHAPGGALRTRQRLADEQLTVLEVGEHLQGCDDDSSSYRQARAPQRHRGIEPAQLPFGAGEESQGDGGLRMSRCHEEAASGPGCAALAVAALRLAPLRQAPTPRRAPARVPLATHPRRPRRIQPGFLIVAKEEE